MYYKYECHLLLRQTIGGGGRPMTYLYHHVRNYGCRVSDRFQFNGLRVVFLENQSLRVMVLADKGADIYEFLYKPLDVDFMWRSPWLPSSAGSHILSNSPAHGHFLDFYSGGWQEIFPQGSSPCIYKGAPYGEHGEVWGLPWEYQILEDTPEAVSVKFWTRTYRSPFYLERVMRLRGDRAILFLEERVVNESRVDLDLMWGHHPVLGPPLLAEDCIFQVPATHALNSVRFAEPTTRFPDGELLWPVALDKHGRPVDLRCIPPPGAGVSDMLFFMGLTGGWASLINRRLGLGFGLAWDRDVFPYVWFWGVFNGSLDYPFYGRTYNLGIEPFSSLPGALTGEPPGAGTALHLRAGESISLKVRAIVFHAQGPIQGLTLDGEVLG